MFLQTFDCAMEEDFSAMWVTSELGSSQVSIDEYMRLKYGQLGPLTKKQILPGGVMWVGNTRFPLSDQLRSNPKLLLLTGA